MLTKLSKPSAFLLIDAKNFYASVEEMFDPTLADHPVGVLSANDGCFISRNDALKELGVPMAAPMFQYKKLLEKMDAKVRSSNFELYLDMSGRFNETLATVSPDVERYSVDECFMELAEAKKSFDYVAREMLDKVHKWTGLVTRVGVGSNKTLSKVANNLAKKSKKANGVVDLYQSKYVDAALERTKIGDVWGIGSNYAGELKKLNVNNALDFKFYNHKSIRKLMTVTGARTHLEINGIRCFDLELTKPIKKVIGISRSFGEPVTTFNELHHAVASFLMLAVKKLQHEDLAARRISVLISSSPFTDNFYAKSQTFKSAYPTDNIFELQEWATGLLKKIYQKGIDYKRAGVELAGLIPKSGVTTRLFPELRIDPRREMLNKLIYEINKKHGHGTLKLASMKPGPWMQKQQFMSERPTTRLDEIIKLY